MKNRTKGLVALALGATMPLGIGSTYALWAGSAPIGDASVSTGTLTLTCADSIDPNNCQVMLYADGEEVQTIEPGTTLTGTVDVIADLQGKNIAAYLTDSRDHVIPIQVSINQTEFDSAGLRTIPVNLTIEVPDNAAAGDLDLGTLTLTLTQDR
jgi:alternate signal-mediated exported protein